MVTVGSMYAKNAWILDGIFRIYRHNFGVILGISAFLYIPLAAVNAVMWTLLSRAAMTATSTPADVLAPIAISVSLYSLLMPLSYGAMTIAVSERYLGRKVTISGAYAVVLKQWYKYVLTSLLFGIVIGGLTLVGLVLLVLPGIAVFVLLCVWFMFFIPVIACEGTWWTGALRRSKELVTGYWGRVFGIWLLVGLIRMVVSAALTAPAQLLTIGLAVAVDEVTAQAVGQSLGTLAQMLVDPILSIAIVLMYYDLRAGLFVLHCPASRGGCAGCGRDNRPALACGAAARRRESRAGGVPAG